MRMNPLPLFDELCADSYRFAVFDNFFIRGDIGQSDFMTGRYCLQRGKQVFAFGDNGLPFGNGRQSDPDIIS